MIREIFIVSKETELGKIDNIKFGLGGRDDSDMGLSVTLTGKGWGVSDFKYSTSPDFYTHLKILLTKAKVLHIDQLKNIPVEATFENKLLRSWRILEEVL